MLLPIIILILLMPLVVLPLVLKTSFSSSELKEMGIVLENPEISSSPEYISQYKHVTPKLHVACGIHKGHKQSVNLSA